MCKPPWGGQMGDQSLCTRAAGAQPEHLRCRGRWRRGQESFPNPSPRTWTPPSPGGAGPWPYGTRFWGEDFPGQQRAKEQVAGPSSSKPGVALHPTPDTANFSVSHKIISGSNRGRANLSAWNHLAFPLQILSLLLTSPALFSTSQLGRKTSH